jgi:hypothetical protein
MEEAYLFKSLGNLLIASQLSSQNYSIAKNFEKQLGLYLYTNSNMLKNSIWLNDRMLRHSFAYTQSLMSLYKLSIGIPKPHEITHNNITNKLTKSINTFTLKALKHSGITDVRQIVQNNSRNLTNLTTYAREQVHIIDIPLGNAYKQLSPTSQNKELARRPKPCYQIVNWEGSYFARKHNVKISSKIETHLIYYTPIPEQRRWRKYGKISQYQ